MSMKLLQVTLQWGAILGAWTATSTAESFEKPPLSYVEADPRGGTRSVHYNTPRAAPDIYSSADSTILNVHVVPHTHDDVGWLKTVDQYHYGHNNTIQHAGIQYVISSIIPQLENNPNRTFTYVEMAYFARWFYEQDESMQGRVRKLVASGQLSFANGGWCMHDEAASHYAAMIDQTTLGHQFLMKEFGVAPRAGWQIDPFGHSSTQASLLSWASGFDALFFGRIDYQDRANRQSTSECEGVWRASPSLGDDAQVFWGLTGQYGGNYYGPPGYDWDVTNNNALPVMDDPNLHGYNVDARVEGFVSAIQDLGAMTKGNHVMLTMGGDFQYESATQQFTNLDKLIHYTNQQAGTLVNVFYSNPTLYADAKHQEGLAWTVKTDDFFPYADGEHAYWTGYFTSRPLLKGFERYTSSWLQGARHLEVLSKQGPMQEQRSTLATLEAASAVNQHHDAVTGTAKQHVTLDYAQRLAAGVNDASDMVSQAFSQMATAAGVPESLVGGVESWVHCPLVHNESTCAPAASASDPSTNGAKALAISVYNPLPQSRSAQVLRVPVSQVPSFVTDAVTGESLEYQVVDAVWTPNSEALPYMAYVACPALKPLGTAFVVLQFPISSSSSESQEAREKHFTEAVPVRRSPVKSASDDDTTFEVSTGSANNAVGDGSGSLTLTFSNATGLLVHAAFNSSNEGSADVSIDLAQQWGYYTAYQSGLEGLDLADCDPSTWVGCPNLAEAEQDASEAATAATAASSEHAAAALSAKASDAAAHVLSGLAHAGYAQHAYLAQAAALHAQAQGRNAKHQALAALAAIPTKGGVRSAVVRFLKRRSEMSPLDLHVTSGGASSSPSAAAALKTGNKIRGHAAAAKAAGALGALLKSGSSTGDDDGADDDADMCSEVAVKVACGADTITRAQCVASGCCWDYNSDPSVSSCFVSDAPPGDDYQNSGAYIFRPTVPTADLNWVNGASEVAVEVIEGPLVVEVRQSFALWLNQTVRLVKGASHAEISFSVGPVPVDDNIGKEVVTRWTSSVSNGDSAPTISTDSNGREFLERIYDYRPTWNLSNAEPVAGNYYPANTAASIKDSQAQLSLVFDRSVGAASLTTGALEVMVHRRLLVDDSRGVGEPLNEFDSSDTGDWYNCKTGEGIVVASTHLLQVQPSAGAIVPLRHAMTQQFYPLVVNFATVDASIMGAAIEAAKEKASSANAAAEEEEKSPLVNVAAVNASSFPSNVKLLTLQAVNPTALLVRLEHAFAMGEDSVLSQPASVNLTAFLVDVVGVSPTGATELTLTGNQPLEDLEHLDWATTSSLLSGGDQKSGEVANNGGGGSVSSNQKRHAGAKAFAQAMASDEDGMVTLNPFEIRTAVIYVQ